MIPRSKLSWKSYWKNCPLILKYGGKLISNVFSIEFLRDMFGLVSGVSAKPIPLASVSLTNKYCYRLCKCPDDDFHFPVHIIHR